MIILGGILSCVLFALCILSVYIELKDMDISFTKITLFTTTIIIATFVVAQIFYCNGWFLD